MLIEDLRKFGLALMIAGAVGAVVREQVPTDAAYTAGALGAIIWMIGLRIAVYKEDERW